MDLAGAPGAGRTAGADGGRAGGTGDADTECTADTEHTADTADTEHVSDTECTAGTADTECTADIAVAVEREWIVRFWSELGLPGLIDVHTHFMPQRVLAKVWAYFDAVEPQLGRAWPITYRYEEERRLATLRGFGVRAFTSMVYPHKPDMAAWLNDWAADFAARTPDCLHTATFYPEPTAAAYVRAALAGGVRVFKAHVQVGGYDPADPLLDPVWGAIAEAGVPVVTHCGSGPTPGAHTGPGPIEKVLARHPRLRLIVAHLGMPEYAEFFDLAERYPGVHLDTTMVFTDFTEELVPFPRALRPRLAALGDRIVLGTDFPNIPYGYHHALDVLTRLDQDAAWLRAVCYENAARLWGIGAAGGTT